MSTQQLNALIHPQGASDLPQTAVNLLKQVLASGIHHVFFLLFLLSLTGVVTAFFLPGRGIGELKSKMPRT
ncbi:hypothetical protein QS257_11930 [Terrilactibacillus sp. S3-3]|nr:hypothetical protein QS257_11930 [Terrilactibacillus sp. S3-3]